MLHVLYVESESTVTFNVRTWYVCLTVWFEVFCIKTNSSLQCYCKYIVCIHVQYTIATKYTSVYTVYIILYNHVNFLNVGLNNYFCHIIYLIGFHHFQSWVPEI